MKKLLTVVLILCLVASTVVVASARSKPIKTYVFKGSVVEVGGKMIRVEVEKGMNRNGKKLVGEEVAVKITGRTEIEIGEDEGDVGDIEEEDQVMIKAKSFKGKQLKALFIHVEDEGDDEGDDRGDEPRDGNPGEPRDGKPGEPRDGEPKDGEPRQ